MVIKMKMVVLFVIIFCLIYGLTLTYHIKHHSLNNYKQCFTSDQCILSLYKNSHVEINSDVIETNGYNIKTSINHINDNNYSFCCEFCQVRFSSRNKLFQHFRNNLCNELSRMVILNGSKGGANAINKEYINDVDRFATVKNDNDDEINLNIDSSGSKSSIMTNYIEFMNNRQSVMLKIAYDYNISTIKTSSAPINNHNNDTVIDDILINIISKFNKDKPHLLNLSRASSRKFRVSKYLQHDNVIGSIGDVIIYSEPSYIHPIDISSSSSSLSKSSSSSSSSLSNWIKKINIEIQKSLPNQLYIISKQIIPKSISLHAEQHYTTKSYDYILPLSYFYNQTYSTASNDVDNCSIDNSTNSSSGGNVKLIIKQKIKKILRLISGEKLSNKGGYKW